MTFTYDSLETSAGAKLAYRRYVPDTTQPGLPGVVFLSGFKSDMTGSKAEMLEQSCRERSQPYLRFDYQGHGFSSGEFKDGTIGQWKDDALTAIDQLTEGPQILIGSSMGGWIMLLCALARPDRVTGLIGIAAAPDFTVKLFHESMNDTQREEIMTQGLITEPSAYGEPYIFTRALIEDGEKQALLQDTIPLTLPVRLLQGKQDPDVPWQTAEKIAAQLASDDVEILYVEDGDHRLSRDEDLALLDETLQALTGQLLLARVAV